MAEDKSKIEVLGRIIECLPGAHFKIEIADQNYPEGFMVEGHLSGKMRVNYIKIIPGDYVNIELSPYDMSKGRIIYRHKGKPASPSVNDNPSESDDVETDENGAEEN